MKRNILSTVLCLCLTLTMVTIPAIASTSYSLVIDLTKSIVLSNTATSIEETGKNLVAPQNPVSPISLAADNFDDVVITAASIQSEKIQIRGTANGSPFDISGIFCSISENGNVLVFNSTDSTNNFRVVYCAIEKELDKAALYFDSFADANPEYNVVTKLYLAPNSDVQGQYIMTELYGNEFPTISAESIAALPENHQLNLFWYAKEFKPTSTDEQIISTRAGNPSFAILESYTFEHIGVTYRHYLRYRELCDIRDVTRNQSSSANATLEITQKWVDTVIENECSSTSSTLSIKNISIGYFTMPETAVTGMKASGTVTHLGFLKSDFTLKVGANIHGITNATTAYLSWTPGNKNYNTGTMIDEFKTNSGGSYWRDAVAEINSSYYLDAIGNKVSVMWSYASYSSNRSSGTANLIFKFGVDNLLDYTQYKHVEHIRPITVNVT